MQHAAWSYSEPFAEFTAIRNYLAFYPQRLECCVDGERVRAQAGKLDACWITGEIVGPLKGETGSGETPRYQPGAAALARRPETR